MFKVSCFLLCIVLVFSLKAQDNSADLTYRYIDIQQVDIVAENFVAEIDFGPAIRVVSAKSNKKHKKVSLAKDEAYFNAIVDNEIDVLIDPIYSIKKKRRILFLFGGNAEVTVVGFAGYYKNVLPESHAKAMLFDNILNDLTSHAPFTTDINVDDIEPKMIVDYINSNDVVLPVKNKKPSILDSYIMNSEKK
jgi:hypothetical protein